MRRVAAAVVLAALVTVGSASGRSEALTVTITGGPTDPTTSTSATFAFTASGRAASFECQLDGGRAVPCASGVTYAGLALGPHRFLVRAFSGREQAVASWAWTVVTGPAPGLPTIHEAPPAEAASAEAMFAFRGSWPAFECSLDGGEPAACSSPVWLSGLAPGRHEFRVRGTGGAAASGWATHTWQVFAAEAPPRVVVSLPFTPQLVPRPPDPPPPPKKLSFKLPAPKISAECAIVWEAAGNKTWYQKKPDALCYTGSTAKAMTLHAAIWALEQGHFTLGETLTYSARAVKQGCTCIGNYVKSTPPGWDWDTDPYAYADVGERTTYEDALYGVAMSAAQPTVAIAEIVAQAVLNGNKVPAASEQASLSREVAFVKQVMNAHTGHAGATKTTFVNEHGGDQALDSSFGGLESKSTARDMAKMWHHFSAEPLFLEVMGLVSYEHLNVVPSTSTTPAYVKGPYAFGKAYWYYPKVQGDKNGSVHPPGMSRVQSLVASSKRLGRTLVVDVMHSDSDPETPENEATDAAKILDYSFRRIFNPKQKATSGELAKVNDLALDCFGSNRCVTAHVATSGAVRLITWKLGVGTGTLQQLGTGPSCKAKGACPKKLSNPYRELDLAYLGVVSGPKLPSPSGPAAVAAPPAPQRSIAVTAARRGLGVESEVVVTSWELKGDGTAVALKTDQGQAGHGIDVGVIRLSPTRFALAQRRHADGRLEFSTWSVTYGGTLAKLDSYDAGKVLEFAFTPSPARPKGFAAVMRHFDPIKTVVRAYEVDDAGQITQLATSGNAATDRRYLSITRVGVGRFAVAGTKGTAGDVAVNFWTVQPAGPSWTVAGGGAMGWFPGDVTDTALAPLGSEAVLLAARDSAVLHLFPMEYDARYKGWGGNEDYFKLGRASLGKGLWPEVGLLQTNAAVAHAVTAHRTTSERLKLVAWEVGKKP